MVGQGCNGVRDPAVIAAGVERGLRMVDTAELYQNGDSERVVGEALRDPALRAKAIVATKVAPQNLGDVRKSLEKSLQRLGMDYVDILYLHWPNPAVETWRIGHAVADAMCDGLIRSFGLSNFSVPEMMQFALFVPPAYIQWEYNLFDRSAKDSALLYAQQTGATFVASSPLDGGRLSWNENLVAAADAYVYYHRHNGATSAQLALAWLLNQGVVPIPKAGHVDENHGAIGAVGAATECAGALEGCVHSRRLLLPPTNISAPPPEPQAEPSVEVLARALRMGIPQKRPRVRAAGAVSEKHLGTEYVLLEGPVRYHAWCRAFPGKPIPVLQRYNQ